MSIFPRGFVFWFPVLLLGSLMEGDFYGRFLKGSLIGGKGGEGNGLEEINFKERFPVEKSSRNVVANALYHTCCKSTLPLSSIAFQENPMRCRYLLSRWDRR